MSENRDGLLDYAKMADEQLADHLRSIEAELILIKAEQESRRNAKKGEAHVMELAKLKERREKLNAINYKSLDQAGLDAYIKESTALATLEMFAAASSRVKVEVPVVEDPLSSENMRLMQLAAMEKFKHLG